jgi:hypothetical protein
MSQREQILEPVVGQLEHREHLLLGQALTAFEHLLSSQTQHVRAYL